MQSPRDGTEDPARREKATDTWRSNGARRWSAGAQMQTQTQRRVGSAEREKGTISSGQDHRNEGATTRTRRRSKSRTAVWSGNTKDACQEIESGDPRIVKLAAHWEPCSKGGLAPQGPVVRGSGLLFFVGSILAAGQANRPMQHLCRILLQWIPMQLRGDPVVCCPTWAPDNM